MSTTITQTQTTIPLSASTGSPQPKGTVPGILNFYVPPKDGSAPYNYVEQPPEGVPRNNFDFEAKEVSIKDMRGAESTFDLNKHAFLPLVSNPITEASTADFTDDESTRKTYYPEVEKLLLTYLPGSPKRILIFDHTIRRSQPNAHREPVMRTHIDQTPASAEARVRHHLPDEADTLLQGRYRLVNVWRPLNGAVESKPLGVADSTTVSDEGLVSIEHRYPDRTGATAGVRFDERMQWYYWSGMGDQERLLLQCFDSESRSRVPHSAFNLPDEEGKKARESIEVRALVFYDY